MDDAAKTGSTSDPKLAAVFLAQAINARAGGAIIAPWEVDQLPDEWADVYQVMAEQGEAGRKAAKEKQRMEHFFTEFQHAHPTFGKY